MTQHLSWLERIRQHNLDLQHFELVGVITDTTLHFSNCPYAIGEDIVVDHTVRVERFCSSCMTDLRPLRHSTHNGAFFTTLVLNMLEAEDAFNKCQKAYTYEHALVVIDKLQETNPCFSRGFFNLLDSRFDNLKNALLKLRARTEKDLKDWAQSHPAEIMAQQQLSTDYSTQHFVEVLEFTVGAPTHMLKLAFEVKKDLLMVPHSVFVHFRKQGVIHQSAEKLESDTPEIIEALGGLFEDDLSSALDIARLL